MFEHLNARTRKIISDVIAGNRISVGTTMIDPFETDQRLALYVIVSNLFTLKELSGRELATKVADLITAAELPEFAEDSHTERRQQPFVRWKVDRVRACSYRGLAPADQLWEHDFSCQSHLLYGPNGCGKSSLLGAISWCLTGQVFRDDCPPRAPSNVDTYTIGHTPRKATTRPDAMTLLDNTGKCVSVSTDYWVELRLCGEDQNGQTHEVWIRRHSTDGLSTATDGTSWTSIPEISAAGISELDTELHIVMPARMPYLHFGENPNLVRLFSQIVGLDDLEAIASTADSTSRAMKRTATQIENGDLKTAEQRIGDAVHGISSASTEEIQSWSAYEAVVSAGRTSEHVKEFATYVKDSLTHWQHQLLEDIGLDMPSKDDPKYKEVQNQLAELSGRVQAAVEQLQKALEMSFITSIGADFPDEDVVHQQAKDLDKFEEQTRKQIRDRLSWAIEEDKDPKAKLMLIAASHFAENGSACPVCAQDLDSVPAIKARLEELTPLSRQPKLEKGVGDVERELLAELDAIVSREQRAEASRSLADRLMTDWQNLKDNWFNGLLRGIADRFDDEVATLAESVRPDAIPDIAPLSGTDSQQYPQAFVSLHESIKAARRYLILVSTFHQNTKRIRQTLTELLVSPSEAERESLLVTLQRGSNANRHVQSLTSVHESTQTLLQAQNKHEELNEHIQQYRRIADWMSAPKSLGQLVRAETIRLIEDVEPQMKRYYEELYENEILEFDMLTSGHAANPEIRNQVNVYLLADDERVPMGPFSNAGRTRALLLAFVFALFDRSEDTLGLLVLDDPALSLDDEHKARFVDRLIAPFLVTKQVLVATHYENFFRIAQPVFANTRIQQLPPRRTVQDHVSFEPGDLLRRLEDAFQVADGSWRDCSPNLRRWTERTLRTISGYCPEPFFEYNKLGPSIDNYGRISDPRIATNRRDEIVSALRSAAVARVIHRAPHDDDPTESEVRDALTVLKECQKQHVLPEIDRLKKLYNHASLGRAIGARANIKMLSFDKRLPQKTVEIRGEAAAATEGVGVNWIEVDSVMLREYQVVRVTTNVLAPIALAGQIVLLDPEDVSPSESDLVAVETEDGARFVRRYWLHDHVPYLENVNPNTPCPPVLLGSGACRMRRVVGVIFEGRPPPPEAGVTGEWTEVGNVSRSLLAGLFGIRVRGTSMEPVARDGQIVFADEDDVSETLMNGEIACVDVEDTEALIKRCNPGDQRWVLTAVNPTAIEDPVIVDRPSIRHVYRLAGVLFETPNR